MSRAFKRESDDDNAEETPLIRRHLPPGARNPITRLGADRLRDRLAALLETKRASVSQGNKAEQRRLDANISKLQAALESAVVADIPVDQSKVAFGAFVSVRHADGEEAEYQIVGIDEAEPGEGRISASSPLARALMNRRVGEKVRFQTPAGDQELLILIVHY